MIDEDSEGFWRFFSKLKVVNDDIFDLTEDEFRKQYGVTAEEYSALVKASQEV